MRSIAPLGGIAAVRAQRAVGEPDGRSEDDLAGGRVELEVAVFGTGLGERGDRPPLLPAVARRHVEDDLLAGNHRCMLELEALSGHSLGHPDHLVGDDLGVDGLGRATRCEA